MQEHGWEFESFGTTIQSRFSNPEVGCGKGSVYGWKTPGSDNDASITAFFGRLPGTAILDYGNCNAGGVVNVYISDYLNQNEIKISTAHGHETTKIAKFEFDRGVHLKINTSIGIIQINSFNISCNGKFKLIYDLYCSFIEVFL